MVTLSVRSHDRVEMIDITEELQRALVASGIRDGLCLVYVPHTTAAVTINEGADPMVRRDLMAHLSRWVPHRGDYRHAEGNADAHIKVAALGQSQALIVEGGRMQLGTWQRVFLCEFDGPRVRTVWVKLVAASTG
jgi:secondary thiamine-phosphate synthase enzyme